MSTKWTFLLPVVVVLNLIDLTQCFIPTFLSESDSISHKEITIKAILQKTAEVCRDIAAANEQDFSLTIDDSLTIEQVHEVCSSTQGTSFVLSSFLFHSSIQDIYSENARVDSQFRLSAERHFDDETFQAGRNIITLGIADVKENVRMENFVTGRLILGTILHTLQDFYSHSNWVELGNMAPYNTLITSEQPLENLAGINIPTCRSCVDNVCDDNILPNVLENRLLTSGYFSPFSSEKPDGKCSRGGSADRTSETEPIGGIGKDTIDSDHGSLHNQAANLAVTATMELLENIRIAEGDENFLRLMGLFQSPVLCFVIDTTSSMEDEIAEVQRLSSEIIESRRGTLLEPPAYILVPFNDPDFGPLLRTSDADFFIEAINNLTASGGGDVLEMSLSALQLALTGAPPLSDIFVFTDAPPKDAFLKSTVTALIEERKSVVTFMLTNVESGRRKRELEGVMSQVSLLGASQLYRDLSRASGGETIEVSDREFALATSIIEDSLRSATVIVFQEERSNPQSFQFTIDNSLENVIISITGNPDLTFNLTSSTGVSQSSNESSGPLASLIMAGTLHRLILNSDSETGLWKISVDSEDPYLVRITGQSPVNFISNFVEAREELNAFFPKDGRPFSGSNVTILITLTGGDSVTLSEVTLYDSAGPTEVNGTSEFIGETDYLVTFHEIPEGSFALRLRGINNLFDSTPSMFQRQAATQISTSTVSVTAEVNITNIEPNSTVFIPFTISISSRGVTNETTDETFTVCATNDRGFESSSPTSVTVEADSGGKANGTLSLTVPENAETGTDVTLTIEVENTISADINFAVLRFGVANRVSDSFPPVCRDVSTSNCPPSSSPCNSSQWEFVVNVTAINGVSRGNVTILSGSGTLNTSTVVGPAGENITVASYRASCCADRVELSAVDSLGNEAICVGQARESTTNAPTTPIHVTTNTTGTGGHTVSTTLYVWIPIVILPLLR
nr:von Willebrand factor A domain-containing protein 7-like [Nerophis lumbriciformis]